jgi:hypothetical protein
MGPGTDGIWMDQHRVFKLHMVKPISFLGSSGSVGLGNPNAKFDALALGECIYNCILLLYHYYY